MPQTYAHSARPHWYCATYVLLDDGNFQHEASWVTVQPTPCADDESLPSALPSVWWAAGRPAPVEHGAALQHGQPAVPEPLFRAGAVSGRGPGRPHRPGCAALRQATAEVKKHDRDLAVHAVGSSPHPC